MMVRIFDKMKPERKKLILSKAEKFINKNTMAIKVFFNNSCSVCRLEINHYKKHCR